jgi:hypothetical protein
MEAIRFYQSETYRPRRQRDHDDVSAIAYGICRLTDGQWWDFDDGQFEAAVDNTQYQSMTADDNGFYINTTGWAIPDANAQYAVQFKITDGTGDFYREGPILIVNDAEPVTAILKFDWDGFTGEADRSMLNALRFLRNKWSISGSTLTITKEDDTTSAWTSTVTGDASANPITASDPA